MIPFKLDYVIERVLQERAGEEQGILKRLAGVRLSPAEARAEWPRVLEHKWFVSERLGRDIGLRVAAIDYFENVRLPRRARKAKSHAPWLRRATQAHGVLA
jgi:hypothetical protein